MSSQLLWVIKFYLRLNISCKATNYQQVQLKLGLSFVESDITLQSDELLFMQYTKVTCDKCKNQAFTSFQALVSQVRQINK